MTFEPNSDCKIVSRTIQVPVDLGKKLTDKKTKRIWVAIGDKPVTRERKPPMADVVCKVATKAQLKWAYENGYSSLVDKVEKA